MKLAEPEITKLVSGRENFKSAAKSMGGQTLQKSWIVVVRKAESFQKNLPKKPVCQVETYFKKISLIMSNKSRYQTLVAVSVTPGGKVPVDDDVLSSHEQEFYPTTSLDENCKDFDIQTDRNCYVDLRQSYLALILKIVRGPSYGTYNSKDVKNERKEEAKVDEAMDEVEEFPVLFITHVTHFAIKFFQY